MALFRLAILNRLFSVQPSDAALSDASTISVCRTVSAEPSVATSTVVASNTVLRVADVTLETEPRGKATMHTVSVHDGLTGSRAAVVDDTGPTIPEVTIDVLFDRVLPQPKIVDNIDKIFARLEKGRWSAYNSRARRWRAFKDDPATAGKHENVVFKNLVSIANAISTVAEAFSDGEAPLTRFDQDHYRAPKSEWRSSESQPDGYFILRDSRSKKTAHWMDIVATGEYKRDEKDVRNLEDDSKKVLWRMHQTLRDDPCRRFTFGFTIENRTMRIWYASRAEILVSTPFDFMNAPLHLIRFFLVMFYSKDHELGWDPTMEYHPAVGKRRAYYIITVVGKDEETGETREIRYKTVKLLSSVGAEGLRGRGTRVWKVRCWKNGKTVGIPVVLKDCWIDSDLMREGDVMAQILHDARQAEGVTLDEEGTTPAQVLEKALLRVVIHGDVTVNGGIDRTMSEEDRLLTLNPDQWFVFHRTQEKLEKFEKLCVKTKLQSGPRGTHRTMYDRSRSKNYSTLRPITYHPKTHYRIISSEVCTVLHKIVSLPMILNVLTELCVVLRALHALGWVHRDISSGNVLVTSDNTVKLADVEYAKKIGATNDKKCHEIRTGTLDFMSVEVDAMEYKFQSVRKGGAYTGLRRFGSKFSTVRGDNSDSELSDDEPNTIKPKESSEDTAQKWAYNPIHDMESLFWLFFFFVAWHDVFVLLVKPDADEATLINKPSETPTKPQSHPSDDSDTSDSDSDSDPDSDPDLDPTVKLPTRYWESPEARADRIKSWYAFGEGLFVKRDARLPVLALPTRLEGFIKEHPLHPATKKMGGFLIACRDSLASAYFEAEKDIASLSSSERRLKVAAGLHEDLFTIFMLARESVDRGDGWVVHIRRLGRQEWKLQQQEKAAKDAAAVGAAGVQRQGEPSPMGPEEVDAVTSTTHPDGDKKKYAAARAEPTAHRAVPLKRGRKPVQAPVKSNTHTRTAAKRKRGAEDDGVDAEPIVRPPPRKVPRRNQKEGSIRDVVDNAEPREPEPVAIKRRSAKATQPPPTRILRSRTKVAQSTTIRPPTSTSNIHKRKTLLVDHTKPAGRTLRPRTQK